MLHEPRLIAEGRCRRTRTMLPPTPIQFIPGLTPTAESHFETALQIAYRFHAPSSHLSSEVSGISIPFHREQRNFQVSEAQGPSSPLEQSDSAAQNSSVRRPLRIALFGFGTVGSSVARILVESKPQGLELTHVFNRGVARKRVPWVPATVVWSEDADAVLASDVDVIVELAGGLDPAGVWVRRALEAGKSVVTANKKLIAYHGVDLERLAAAKGGHLKYGAAVAGGIPVIPGLEQGLAGDRIERMEGILNGTCNFILSKMDEGAEYATVLAEAQAKGYAEADPTEDVGGFDARAKLAILMRLALRVVVDPEEIVPQPITAVSAVDFSYARDPRLHHSPGGARPAGQGPRRCHRRAHAGRSSLAPCLVARH